MERIKRFKKFLEELCEWVYRAMGQEEYEIGTPCPLCGHSMLYTMSDSFGTWFYCKHCDRKTYRRRG